jgi:hypothetical protein
LSAIADADIFAIFADDISSIIHFRHSHYASFIFDISLLAIFFRYFSRFTDFRHYAIIDATAAADIRRCRLRRYFLSRFRFSISRQILIAADTISPLFSPLSLADSHFHFH